MTGMPKIVWMLWLQGWDGAPPPLVSACRESWERLNPDWEVRALDRDDLLDLVPRSRLRLDLPPAAISDVARIELLRDHGGVWADASVYATRPLDDWLPDRPAGGFFAFDSPAPDRMLASWFLASEPGGYVVDRWAEAMRNYWADRDTPHAYYWLHYLFAELYESDPEFARTWDATPKWPADGPHYFAPYRRRLTGKMSRRTQARLASGVDPLFKLTAREIVPDYVRSESAWEFFVDGAHCELSQSRALLVVDRPLEVVRWWRRDAAEGLRHLVRSRISQ